MTHRPDQIRIRRARADDSRSLANLRYAFRAKGEKVIETKAAFLKRCERWIKKRISGKQSWQCWVAEDRGGVIGNIWVELIEKIPNPVSENERHGYITNFYVAPEARGQRIGEKLLRAALNWCCERQMDAVILWPSKRSRTIYLRHGFAIPDDLFQLRGARISRHRKDPTDGR